jgi:hypothetical protein
MMLDATSYFNIDYELVWWIWKLMNILLKFLKSLFALIKILLVSTSMAKCNGQFNYLFLIMHGTMSFFFNSQFKVPIKCLKHMHISLNLLFCIKILVWQGFVSKEYVHTFLVINQISSTKSFNRPSIFMATHWKPNAEKYDDFYSFSLSLLTTETFQQRLHIFCFLIFNFIFWRNFASKKKGYTQLIILNPSSMWKLVEV